MSQMRAEIRPLLEDLAHQDGLPPNAVSDLEATIASSPYLQNVMASAIKGGTLKHLAITDAPHEGGRYVGSSGTINLDVDNFNSSQSRSLLAHRDNLAVVLGHEAGHALLADAELRERYKLSYETTDAIRAASRDGTAADLTASVERYLSFTRRNEALAELIGLNSLASRTTGGVAAAFDRDKFLARADPSTPCIENGILAKGIALGEGGIQFTGNKLVSPAVEAVAQCYTDNASSLGQHGDSGYRAYYGGGLMETLYEARREYAKGTTMHVPDIELDLAKLKLDPRKIERAGVDLGGRGNSFDFVDTSAGRREYESVSHTHSGRSTQSTNPREPVARNETPDAPTFRADHPDHPDHPAFDSIRATVRADGRWDDAQSSNIAAALLREHKADPLSHRLDRVVIGNTTAQGETNVFAVYAPHGDKDPFFTTRVEMNAAAQIPAERNLEQVEQINRRHIQKHHLSEQLDTQIQTQNPTRTLTPY
ncbi:MULTISPECIES: XVIPCD domain-containing protein [Lysobacter]|uniref:XVIPCD domain-containing protein n=1 Tax=Lysobacter firmicutimachus TaxID=1792846 RepID=A0ABU8D4Q6_9GAMM|nr:XVIPCD domain-containing protein [Lysobacter antibioticus]